MVNFEHSMAVGGGYVLLETRDTSRGDPSGVARRSGLPPFLPHPPQPMAAWVQPGSRFGPAGRFELVELIGAGGAGRVFRVRDHELERDVAAKFFVDKGSARPPSEHLLLEARATARLNHPNIVSVFDVGRCRGVPYFLMEYLQGKPLDQVLNGGCLPVGRALAIILQVVRGLRYAHRAGVLHLDLKPSNIILSERDRVKIIDFGVAGCTAACAEDSDSFVGTPAYMAPEQWLMGPLDERTDVWAVGLLLCEMLTGALPDVGFCCRSMNRARVAMFSKNRQADGPGMQANAELDDRLLDVLRRTCALQPELRFSDMDHLLRALQPGQDAFD